MTPPQPAGQAIHPPVRVLVLLVCGHVAVAVAAVVLAVPLVADALGRSDGPGRALPTGWLPGMLAAGLAALVLAQVLSVRRVLGHHRALARARAVAPHGPDPRDTAQAALVTAMYRTGWPVAFAHHPMLFGMLPIALVPPPTPLLAPFCVLPAASLLLDHAHAGWTYRYLQGHGPRSRLLPPGDGDRIRRGLRHTPALLITAAAAGALLALLAAPWQAGGEDRPTTLLPALLPALAATSAALLPLLLVRPVRQVRAAIRDDSVHRPALDAAAHTMRRLGAAGTAATALLGAAVLTNPTAALLAAAPTLLLVPALSWVTLHLASATSIAAGAPFPTGNPWARRSTGTAGSPSRR